MATRKKTSKSAFIIPSPKHKRFTDTEAQIDKNGNISFAFVDFPIIRSQHKPLK